MKGKKKLERLVVILILKKQVCCCIMNGEKLERLVVILIYIKKKGIWQRLVLLYTSGSATVVISGELHSGIKEADNDQQLLQSSNQVRSVCWTSVRCWRQLVLWHSLSSCEGSAWCSVNVHTLACTHAYTHTLTHVHTHSQHTHTCRIHTCTHTHTGRGGEESIETTREQNQHTRELISTQNMLTQVQQQRPELPTVTPLARM